MTKKFLTPIDLTKNEIQNAVVQNLASAPGTPVTGQFYYDTTTNKFMWRNNSAFIDMLARANHTGTQLASTISDFDTQVRTSRLDQLAAPTASVSLNSQKITNLLDGTSAQDAVTKSQLDAVLNGRDFKDSVRAATTANGTLATAFANGQTIDGVTLVTGNRILLKNQTTAADNGIYVVQASGAPVRATDADTSAKVTPNMSVMVEEGTTLGDTQWTLTTNSSITLGSTSLTFAQTGNGTTYTQGTGISIASSVISIDTSVTARRFAANVGDGSSTSIAVTHSLGTADVIVQLYQVSDGVQYECDVTRNSTNQVTLAFAVAPTSNQFRVVVTG